MKTVDVQSRTLLATGQVLSLAGSLLLAGPAFANQADGHRGSLRQLRFDNPEINKQELRQLFRANGQERNQLRHDIREQTGGGKAFHAEYQAIKNSLNIASPVVSPSFAPKNDYRSTYVSERGRTRDVTRGLALDLTSSDRAIVLGENLFAGASSYTVNVGGADRVLTSGSRVTSAEFVALQQVIDGGSQKLVVDQSGRGVDGSFTLNSIDDAGRNIKASSLTVSAGVDAVGNFGRNSDFKITRELVNYGNIYALSDNAAGNKANIGARDITNHADATISTIVPAAVADEHGAIAGPVDLTLSAERDLSNSGTISGSGSVTLSAGQSVRNSGSILAQSNLNLQSPAVYNSGSISSNSADVRFDTPVAADILVDNTGGTISAAQGSINFRGPSFTPKVDTTLTGGDWLSKELNLHSGDGHVQVDVGEVSGAVNAYAGTARINADSAVLFINDLVTSGDPLISNTSTILLGNQATSGGPLTVVSGMDIQIQSGVTLSTNSATGDAGDILLLAGAAFTPGAGNITVNGPSATGGNVTFVGTAPSITANSSNGDGGDITIAAFFVGGQGQINLNGSTITSQGSSGKNNGNVLMLASSITTGFIDTKGAGSTNTGKITLIARQPAISGSLVISDPNGDIVSGSLIPGAVVGSSAIGFTAAFNAGNSVLISSASSLDLLHPITTSSGSLTILTTQDLTMRRDLIAPGGIVLVAGHNIGTNVSSPLVIDSSSSTGNGGSITIVAGAAFTDTTANVTISGATSSGGQIGFFNGDLGNMTSKSTSAGGSGGDINLIAFYGTDNTGALFTSNGPTITTGGNGAGKNGNFTAVAGHDGGGNAIQLNGVNTTGGLAGTGNITVLGATPNTTPNVVINIASGAISSGNFAGGTKRQGSISTALLTFNGSVAQLSTALDVSLGGTAGAGNSKLQVSARNIVNPGDLLAGNISLIANNDVTLQQDVIAAGGIVVVSGHQIQTNVSSPLSISSQSASGDSGGITMVAGATFTETSSDVTITGGSSSGGRIVFFNSDLGNMSSSSSFAGGDGGDINLIAYYGTDNTGDIVTSNGPTIFTGGKGAGANGNFVAVAGHNGGGNAMVLNGINTTGGQTGTGNIDLHATTPGNNVVVSKSTGKVTSGSFLGGVRRLGSITTGLLTFDGSVASLSGGQDASLGGSVAIGNSKLQVSVNRDIVNQGDLSARNISLIAGNNITLRQDLIAPGGIVVVSGHQIQTNVSSPLSISSQSASGDSGGITMVAGATFTETSSDVTITGGSSSGGRIVFFNSDLGNMSSSSSFAGGDGGDINLIAYYGTDTTGDIATSNGPTIFTGGNGAGANGNFVAVAGHDASGNAMVLNGINTTGGQTGTGNIDLHATTPGNNVVVSKSTGEVTSGSFLGGVRRSGSIGTGLLTFDGSVASLSGGLDASLGGSAAIGNSKLQVSVNRDITNFGDLSAGNISLIANNDVTLKQDLIAPGGIVVVSGHQIQTNIISPLSISSQSASGDSGGITMVAGATFTETAGDVTITGATSSGGRIIFSNSDVSSLTSSSTGGNGDGGDINLIAFNGTDNTGQVNTGSGAAITAGGNGSGANGSISIVAGHNGGGVGISATDLSTTGGANGTGSVLVMTATPDTTPPVVINKSTAAISSGDFTTGPVVSGSINLNNIVTDGGAITVNSGLNVVINNINASGIGVGNGGTISVETNSTELQIGSASGANRIANISFNGGSTSGDGGDLSIKNNGLNGVRIFGTVLQQSNTKGDGGNIIVDADQGALTFNTGIIAANGQGASPQNGGSISLIANNFVLAAGNMSLQTNGASGGNGGSISITSALAINNIIGPGPAQFSLSQTGPNSSLSLASTGAGVTINAPITVGTLSLTSTNADIVQTAGSTFNVSTLNINLLGVTPGTADLDNFVNSVGAISGTGGGSIFLDNGATNLQLGALGATQSLTASTTGTMSTISNITTTGDINLTTIGLTNNHTMTANTIAVTSPGTSNLTVTGTGTFDATGAGQQVTFDTDGDMTIGGTFNFLSDAQMTVNTPAHLFTVAAGANIVGLQTVIVNVIGSTYQPIGSLIGNPLIINGGGVGGPGTIANSTGDVVLNGNVIIIGGNIAIIAAGNITGNGLITIDSSAAGSAGSITLLAGFDFTPPTPGQVTDSTTTFTNFSANATGGSINLAGVNINASSTGGGGGNVLIVANDGTTNNGSITLGNIDAFGNTNGGNIKVVGENTITLGNLHNSAPSSVGSIDIAVATPIVTGAPQILNGTLSGGTFGAGALGTGNVSVGTINAGTGALSIQTSGQTSSVTVGNSLIAGDVNLFADAGNLNLSNLSDITVLPDAAGDGGNLFLTSGTLTLKSSAATQLNANGSGTGAGGTIKISHTDQSSVYIGNVPKAKSGSLFLSAKGGATGDGGTIDVSAGGNLTVETSGLQAGPGTGGDGASLKLAAGSASSKGGSLAITGSLYASGSGGGAGGTIELISRSKTAFNIGTTKTPKNGVLGQLSANDIIIDNQLGGVTVSSGNALTANNIELRAAGKGSISAGSGVIISALTELKLFATTADIGGKTPLYVNTPLLTVDTQGGVSIAGKGGGLLTLADSTGRSFKLVTVGGVALNNLTAEDGNICITANSGTLSVGAGKIVEAKNGELCLTNCNTLSGNILLGDNSIIETSGQGEQVSISIGTAPTNPVAVTPPLNVNISESGGGKVIFATPATGFVIGAIASDVSAIGKNVILANGATLGQKITFGDNVTVTADPPIGARSAQSHAMIFPSQAGEAVGQSHSLTDIGSCAVTGSGAPLPALTGSALNAQTITAVPTDLLSSFRTTASEEIKTVSNLSIGALQAAEETVSQTFITDAYVWCDVDLGLGSATTLKREGKISASRSSAATEVFGSTDNDSNVEVATLRKGTIVLAPSKDTRLDTPMGTVEVAKGSVALVVLEQNRLGVYDLHDARKGSVRVSSGSNATILSPGRCTLLTNQVQNGFERINPMESIGYRSVASVNHGNGIKAFNAEFSTTHALESVKPLMEILTSKHAGARRMSSRLIKTSAVLMHLGGSEDFKIYAEPSVTAMNP